jgi:hypothetical protein
MTRKSQPIGPEIKVRLGFSPDDSDQEVRKWWKKASMRSCKPCWELRYCPYGPVVEDFPLLPLTREDAIAHNEYLKESLRTGILGDGQPIDKKRKAWFKKEVKEFNPEEYVEQIPQEIADMQCNIYGHICPVVYVGSDLSEAIELRRRGRYIPFNVKMRVVRRDNYTCQSCGKHLLDNEVEFDHIIPVAKGGNSEEHNIRLTCFECNRAKSDKVEL